MTAPEVLERIAARCAELDGLEEQLCRSTARTITAILPGGSTRHRDRIAFRCRRSRSARWLTVCEDSGSRHW
ncbi:hypothetical protein ACFY3J_38135 [Streptomyces sp. NPDC001231]|uniref:hypothetical protein n=1 Tax=Streptomyces sp. NPDC001231 TaxID=3364549 RepID=UPI00369C7217